MSTELFIAFATFAFVSSITPGPNNLMLMASGANFGFRRTLWHMFGVGIGFVVMIVLVGAGLARIFTEIPETRLALKVLATLYMLWLAWKIAHAAAPASESGEGRRPMNFMEAAAFQWVNPKAWAMALAAVTVYAPSQTLGAILIVALVFGAINIPCIAAWVSLGQEMRRILTKPSRLTAFNWTMAALLVASLYPVLKL